MKRVAFGKDFTLTYSYADESAPSTDAPSIAIYSEQPEKSDASNATGTYKIGSTITSWSNGTPANTKTFDVPAIEDPNPLDNATTDTYYAAINYTLEDSGQSQLVITPFYIDKPFGTISGHELVVQDIKDIFPTIDEYIDDAVITKYLTMAITDVEEDLRKRHKEFDQVINKDDIKRAIALRAIAECSYSQFIEENDQFYIRSRDYQARYEKALDSVRIKIDTDSDGDTDLADTKKIYYKFNNTP